MLPELYIKYLMTESIKIKSILHWAVINISVPELKGDAMGHIFTVSLMAF